MKKNFKNFLLLLILFSVAGAFSIAFLEAWLGTVLMFQLACWTVVFGFVYVVIMQIINR